MQPTAVSRAIEDAIKGGYEPLPTETEIDDSINDLLTKTNSNEV